METSIKPGITLLPNPMDGFVADFHKKQENALLVGEAARSVEQKARISRIRNKRDVARGKRKRMNKIRKSRK